MEVRIHCYYKKLKPINEMFRKNGYPKRIHLVAYIEKIYNFEKEFKSYQRIENIELFITNDKNKDISDFRHYKAPHDRSFYDHSLFEDEHLNLLERQYLEISIDSYQRLRKVIINYHNEYNRSVDFRTIAKKQ